MTPHSSPVVCVHEDRAAYLPGLQLAVLSLARHAPGTEVVVSSPGASASFAAWVEAQPNARLGRLEHIQGSGWNIKPSVLLAMLEQHDDVMWIDADIIVAADLGERFSRLDRETLVATEETHWGQQQGGDFRTLAWGFERGRTLPCTVNSGILRVTRAHVPMLQAWQAMLSHPRYLEAQALPWYARPLHMIGDQEALSGLLGSAEFARIPVDLLARGTEIAQCFGPAGFTPMERLHALQGRGPLFVHAMGPKPWLRGAKMPSLLASGSRVSALRNWYGYLALDTAPYCVVARRYADQAESLGIDMQWTEPRSAIGKACAALGRSRPPLPGLPLALVDHLARQLRKTLGIARYPLGADFMLTERPF